MNAIARPLLLLAAFVGHGTVVAQQSSAARAQDWPRFHVGVAFSPFGADVNLNVTSLGGIPAQIGQDSTRESDSARKVVVGYRPLRVLGMEIQRLDLGEASHVARGGGGQVALQIIESEGSADATVLSALLFIPERAASVDFYAKVGIADLEESLKARGYTAFLPGCVPAIPNCEFDIQAETSESSPYVGFGARVKAAKGVGIRIEFESIDRDSGSAASLLTVGVAAEF